MIFKSAFFYNDMARSLLSVTCSMNMHVKHLVPMSSSPLSWVEGGNAVAESLYGGHIVFLGVVQQKSMRILFQLYFSFTFL